MSITSNQDIIVGIDNDGEQKDTSAFEFFKTDPDLLAHTFSFLDIREIVVVLTLVCQDWYQTIRYDEGYIFNLAGYCEKVNRKEKSDSYFDNCIAEDSDDENAICSQCAADRDRWKDNMLPGICSAPHWLLPKIRNMVYDTKFTRCSGKLWLEDPLSYLPCLDIDEPVDAHFCQKCVDIISKLTLRKFCYVTEDFIAPDCDFNTVSRTMGENSLGSRLSAEFFDELEEFTVITNRLCLPELAMIPTETCVVIELFGSISNKFIKEYSFQRPLELAVSTYRLTTPLDLNSCNPPALVKLSVSGEFLTVKIDNQITPEQCVSQLRQLWKADDKLWLMFVDRALLSDVCNTTVQLIESGMTIIDISICDEKDDCIELRAVEMELEVLKDFDLSAMYWQNRTPYTPSRDLPKAWYMLKHTAITPQQLLALLDFMTESDDNYYLNEDLLDEDSHSLLTVFSPDRKEVGAAKYRIIPDNPLQNSVVNLVDGSIRQLARFADSKARICMRFPIDLKPKESFKEVIRLTTNAPNLTTVMLITTDTIFTQVVIRALRLVEKLAPTIENLSFEFYSKTTNLWLTVNILELRKLQVREGLSVELINAFFRLYIGFV
jgi:hypothetical protein